MYVQLECACLSLVNAIMFNVKTLGSKDFACLRRLWGIVSATTELQSKTKDKQKIKMKMHLHRNGTTLDVYMDNPKWEKPREFTNFEQDHYVM